MGAQAMEDRYGAYSVKPMRIAVCLPCCIGQLTGARPVFLIFSAPVSQCDRVGHLIDAM